MNKGTVFFLVFILTILAIRLFVFLFPDQKVRIFGIVIHHFWIGLILVLIALLLKGFEYEWILFSIGLAMFSDELVYMILGAGPVSNYWKIYSVSGAILNSLIVFILKNRIVDRI